MLFGGILIFIVGSLINVWFINPPKREYLYIAWQAPHVPHIALEELSDRIGVILDNNDRYQVSVRSYVLTDDVQMTQAIVTRFHALLSVGDIHAVISNRQGMQENAEFGLVRHPEEMMAVLRETNPPLYDIITERLLTITVELLDDDPVTDTKAIDISGAPLLVELGFTMDDLYIGFVANSQRYEQLARALAVIFDLE